ncbi:MAG: glycosyltransferase family 9 protein [Paludibacteraceae bacterium]|nr:glycosyltransferase family 9 protein [Paludibacteraceae bacterium]
MKSVLVIRLSAMGDVAMTIPVLYSVARQHPDVHFTLLTRDRFTRLLLNAPGNVDTIGIDPDQYHGLKGLSRLYKQLKEHRFDAVADLHDVLRSKYLRLRFALNSDVKVRHIHKGRWQKRRLTARCCKHRGQLPSSFYRYAEVFRRLGFQTEERFESVFDQSTPDYAALPEQFRQKPDGQRWIGIAPFAKFAGKIYPIDMMEQIIDRLIQQDDVRMFLFGFGKEESDILERFASKSDHIVSCAGRFSPSQELILMSLLDVMLSMDSANMHLASLVGTRVVSLWGATHPWAGFMGWKQSTHDAIGVSLDCRPCSVFGNKPCRRKDEACMRQIRPEDVVRRLLKQD